jgi:hypothetical protein
MQKGSVARVGMEEWKFLWWTSDSKSYHLGGCHLLHLDDVFNPGVSEDTIFQFQCPYPWRSQDRNLSSANWAVYPGILNLE